MTDDISGEMLQILARLGQLNLHFLDLLAVLVNVEKRNAADANGEKPLDVWLRQLANQLATKRFEPLAHGRENRLVGPTLLNLLVEAFLDEDALQRAEVQLILQMGFFQLQLALENLHQLRCVLPQDLGHGQLHRPVVPDDNDAAGDGDFTIGERIKRVRQLLRTHPARRLYLDLHLLGGEIVDAPDLDLAFARSIFDRTN